MAPRPKERLTTTGERRTRAAGVVALLLCLALLGGCGRWQQELDEQVAEPVRIRVPVISVDAPVEPLFVDEKGALPAPDTFEGTGWWTGGPEPGERGPAVIAGHLDSRHGPAVFHRLDDLTHGDTIFVDRADGSTAIFATDRIEQHGKDDFPTQAVYGDTADSQLRLITCGGTFDKRNRRYLDNVIVYAVRVG